MNEEITNEQIQSKVIEGANKIIKQNNVSLEKVNRLTDYLNVNETNVRNIHKMVHDLKDDFTSLKVQTNRIEAALDKIVKHLNL